jgi:threonine aldolase
MNTSVFHKNRESSAAVQRCQFASDNYSGICPEAWEAMAAANEEYAPSYGDDRFTDQACNLLREQFETDCQIFFVFNGTAANALAVASLCKPFHSVICHQTAHLETDECGAPEFFSSGSKVLLVGGEHGKLDPAEIERVAKCRSDIHYPKPHALSITQATELGTVYTVDELRNLGLLAKAQHLRVHMDGARLANALATLNTPLKEITWKAGVDVVCLGCTKNGGMMGEAVVFFDSELAAEFDYRAKQAGQLASKMRFLSAQWIGMLRDGAWLRHAAQANHCAALLDGELRKLSGLQVLHSREANSVFVDMPPDVVRKLHERGWSFYTFIGTGGARFMCSWETKEENVRALVADFQDLLGETG